MEEKADIFAKKGLTSLAAKMRGEPMPDPMSMAMKSLQEELKVFVGKPIDNETQSKIRQKISYFISKIQDITFLGEGYRARLVVHDGVIEDVLMIQE